MRRDLIFLEDRIYKKIGSVESEFHEQADVLEEASERHSYNLEELYYISRSIDAVIMEVCCRLSLVDTY